MKRIIICCDGTWSTPESETPSNVVLTARSILPVDSEGVEQVVYYDWGVGTEPGQKYRGGAVGAGIDKNIRDAYRFLCHNYVKGDEVFLFGFSRGAYTIRSLVGMLKKCGLLLKPSAGRIPEAYQLYRSKHGLGSQTVKLFKESSIPLSIKYLGVWDTVGALGIPLLPFYWFNRAKYKFHDTRLSHMVENAFHALALDEKRRVFSPTLWTTEKGRPGTQQVWFRGAHSDVGGGSGNIQLSQQAFNFIVNKARACGLQFSTAMDQAPTGDSKPTISRFSLAYLLGVEARKPLITNHDESLGY